LAEKSPLIVIPLYSFCKDPGPEGPAMEIGVLEDWSIGLKEVVLLVFDG
jgi:hypothetical protein